MLDGKRWEPHLHFWQAYGERFFVAHLHRGRISKTAEKGKLDNSSIPSASSSNFKSLFVDAMKSSGLSAPT